MLIIICPEIEDKQKGEQTKVKRKFKWKKEKVFDLETNKSRKQIETFEKGFNNTFHLNIYMLRTPQYLRANKI